MEGRKDKGNENTRDPSLEVVPVIIRCTNCHILFNDQENGPDPPTPSRTLPAGHTHVGLSGLVCSALPGVLGKFPFIPVRISHFI